MEKQELEEFCAELNKLTNWADKQRYGKLYFDKMIRKYGNQNKRNGIFDAFIDALNKNGIQV